MELKDTIANMTSSDYKARMIAEYQQTKIRYEKLKDLNTKIEAADCSWGKIKMPEINCPPHLLRDQQEVMGRYLHILEIRAELEGLDLGKESFCHKACCACEEKIIRPVASL